MRKQTCERGGQRREYSSGLEECNVGGPYPQAGSLRRFIGCGALPCIDRRILAFIETFPLTIPERQHQHHQH